MRCNRYLSLSVLIACVAVALVAAAPAFADPALVADVNPGSASSNLSDFVAVGSTLYFVADDGSHGFELWKTDGTSAGTEMVKDINPGGGTFPQDLVNVNGTLFFSADDGTHGSELWKSDGTPGGTVLVKDINPGSATSEPFGLTALGGELLFAADDGTNGRELWKSDGTAAGTTLLKDINPGAAASSPSDLVSNGAIVFFSAIDGVHGDELWKTDGTAAGTTLVADINPGPGDASPQEPANINGTLFFNAFDGTNHSLWKSNGTTAGTTLVKTIGSLAEDITNVGGTAYFSASDTNDGFELWKSDGTAAGTVMVKDISPGPGSSQPQGLTDLDGTLIFDATDGADGAELWRSDGTAAGTVMVKDINPGASDSNPGGFALFDGELYFTAIESTDGRELWKTDGTDAGTTLVADINPGAGSSSPGALTPVNGTLLFAADDGIHGAELWGLAGGSAGDSTSTAIRCSPASVTVGVATACTATVSDTAGGGDPTGSVSFTTDSGGSFESGGVCMLSSTGTAGVAACTVNYIPSSVGNGAHTITGTYGGDGSHTGSHGATRVAVSSSGGGSGGGGGGGGGSGGGSGGGNGPVIARFGSVGLARTLSHALLLNGSSSTSGTGGISDYTWIVGAPGQPPEVDPCGPSPLVAMSFQHAGMHSVTLQVKNALGQTSQVTQQLNVPVTAANQWFQASYDCENPGANNVPNRGDCVKTFGWGVVEVNSRGFTNDCFQLQQRDALRQLHGASDRAATALPPKNLAHVWATHATINGPIAIDGLYLPLPEQIQSSFDDWNSTIQIGQPIPIAVGGYRLASIVLNTVVGDPDRDGMVPLKANVGLSGSNNSFGALPLAGTVDVNLSTATNADGFHISKVKLHVKLPSPFSLPVDGYLESDNETGAHLTGFQVGPFNTDLLPGFTLKNAFFKYVGGTDNVWEGGANIFLPGQVLPPDGSPLPAGLSPLPGINFSPPPPDLGIGFRNGQFDHFGIGLTFVPPFQPVIFPGVNLSNVHFAIGQGPLRFTGGIGIAIGSLIGVDGDAFVAFAENQPYHFPNDVATGDLSPLAGRWLDSFTVAVGGDAHLTIPAVGDIPLLNAWLIYEAPDYFEIGSHFDFKVTLLELKGDAGGWVLPSQGKFSLGGDISLCMNVHVLGFDLGSPCLGNGVVISSRGFGGCATVLVPSPIPLVPAVPVTIAAGYTWDGDFEVTPFSCDLGDFTEANPRGAADHSGPTARTAQAGWAFNLRSGLPSAEVRVTGQGGAPAVTLSGPGSQTYSTASPPTDPRRALIMQYGDTTVIAVNHPAAGRWSVSQAAGSVPVGSVAYASGLPDPAVKARVGGRGRARTLTYHLTPAPGRVVTFVERGARTYHVLGVAHGTHGRIRFAPAPGRAGRRQIVAVVTEHGIQSQSPVVASYLAPGPQRPARPERVRVAHHGFTLNVSWKPAAGAATYEVVVEASDGGRETAIVRGHHASIAGIEPGLHGKVLVDAVSADGRRGPTTGHAFARARIVPPKRPKLPKPRRR